MVGRWQLHSCCSVAVIEAPLAAPVDKMFCNNSAIQTGATWIIKRHNERGLVASDGDNLMENTEIKYWFNGKLCDYGIVSK